MIFGLLVQPAFDGHELHHHRDTGDQPQTNPGRHFRNQRLGEHDARRQRPRSHIGPDVPRTDDEPVSDPGAAHLSEVIR